MNPIDLAVSFAILVTLWCLSHALRNRSHQEGNDWLLWIAEFLWLGTWAVALRIVLTLACGTMKPVGVEEVHLPETSREPPVPAKLELKAEDSRLDVTQVRKEHAKTVSDWAAETMPTSTSGGAAKPE